MDHLKKIQICNLPLMYYIPVLLITLVATYTHSLNNDVVGGCLFLYVIGGLFFYVGGIIPIFGTYMGGAILLPLFGGSALAYFHLVPAYLTKLIAGIMGSGAINIFIAAIVVGSILSMDRKVLLEVSARLIPVMLIALAFAIVFMVITTFLTGQSLIKGFFNVGIINYTGGSSGALVVVPTIYHGIFHNPVTSYSGKFIVLMNISNLICVIFAGILNQLGKKKPEWTGNGALMKGSAKVKATKVEPIEMDKKSLRSLGIGFVISLSLLVLGNILQTIVPQLNYIAWTSLLAIALKAFGVFNDKVCRYSANWQGFVVSNFIAFLITGIGIVSLDLGQLISYFTLSNFLIIAMGVIGAMLGALLGGKALGFYPIDSMIAVGVQLGNVGGSGAVATLSTAERMELMPFAIISNRIGGAIVVILLSLLVPLFV
ncbi:MAG: 2-hydroxycarboxylate transporter family protein [Liquorilactobacillus ghanensis]|jgi:Na+/citrate or Na+/malate symporter|uniref:Citrate carrier protein n=1 Tax=Liquorilactobacillus ghanensis DSM 18630 TaxID=1423750 RepID=A0A0R1VKM5_9LACO|nr:2-hydroxycarboxylate transporter family protein [Liquorilactobacillus ghanensis]KRM06082.1 hypothetical protein FC89_GL000949 [Liquorilactobacillus ghanensis DSM 18630]